MLWGIWIKLKLLGGIMIDLTTLEVCCTWGGTGYDTDANTDYSGADAGNYSGVEEREPHRRGAGIM